MLRGGEGDGAQAPGSLVALCRGARLGDKGKQIQMETDVLVEGCGERNHESPCVIVCTACLIQEKAGYQENKHCYWCTRFIDEETEAGKEFSESGWRSGKEQKHVVLPG